MNVRLRLALWNVAVLALALVGLGTVLRARVQADLLAGVDRELLNRARFIQGIPIPPRAAWRSSRAPTSPALTPPFFDRDGRNVVNGAPAPDRVGVSRSFDQDAPVLTTLAGIRYLTLARGAGPDRVAFQTSESLAPILRQLAQLTRTLWTLLPLALSVAALGGLFLTDRALRPVRSISDAAAQIGAGDLSRRLPVTGRDEFARLAATFNGMLARLEDAFARQRRFVADASHELKTPLTVIKANSSLALSDPDLPETVLETLTEIDRAADRTVRISRDLLLLARADADALPMERERVPVATLFDEAVRDARRLHPGGARLVARPDDSVVFVDPHQFHRLLLNLLDNALRHTPPEGTVTLSAKSGSGATLLTLSDTGAGIASEHLPHLGERFFRPDVSRARKDGGTGLGLAIARAIAQAHDATLTIESVPGNGTTVHVQLPTA